MRSPSRGGSERSKRRAFEEPLLDGVIEGLLKKRAFQEMWQRATRYRSNYRNGKYHKEFARIEFRPWELCG